MLRQVPMQLLVQKRREQFVIGAEKMNVQRQRWEGVVHGPLLDDDGASERVFADVVFLKQLLEFHFLLEFTRGVVTGLDLDGITGERGQRKEDAPTSSNADKSHSPRSLHRLHSSII